MQKLVGYLVGLAITIAIMYVIGFIIACVITVVILLVRYVVKSLQTPKEYTPWEFDCEYQPRVTYVNDEGYFQNVTSYKRFNNFEQKWEFKKEIDPVLRPFSQAKSLSDKYFLIGR